MVIQKKYLGIFYMLLAALGFSIMGGAAKLLKGSFNAGQLVFYRNLVGLIVLLIGFAILKKSPWLLAYGLIWTSHIGLDRLLGFGLKYPTRFNDTHLQRVGSALASEAK